MEGRVIFLIFFLFKLVLCEFTESLFSKVVSKAFCIESLVTQFSCQAISLFIFSLFSVSIVVSTSLKKKLSVKH